MDTEAGRSGSLLGMARWAAALVILLACFLFAWMASFAFGTYYLSGVGLDRLREQGTGLFMACVAGLGGVAAFRAMTQQHVLSPWLLAGLVLPVVGALNHLGITH